MISQKRRYHKRRISPAKFFKEKKLIVELELNQSRSQKFFNHINENKVVYIIGSVAIVSGFAWYYAPSIAAFLGKLGILGSSATGIKISKLTGAALKKAALAKLGFGAKSIGGFGIFGGKINVTISSAAIQSKTVDYFSKKAQINSPKQSEPILTINQYRLLSKRLKTFC